MKDKNYIPALSFDFLTKFYDTIISLTMPEKNFRNALVEECFEQQSNLNALEFGIGTASNSIIAKKRFPANNITGIDVDTKVLGIAKKKIEFENVEILLIQYDGVNSNLPGENFDLVFSSLVFHHLNRQQKEQAFIEINRLLKKNGKLIFVDWGKPENLFTKLGFFMLRLFDGWSNTKDNYTGNYLNLIRNNGFKRPERIGHFNTVFGTLELVKTHKL